MKKLEDFPLVVPVAALEEPGILGVEPFSFCVQDDQHRKAESLRIAVFFQDRQVHILPAVVDAVSDKIGFDKILDLLVLFDKIMQAIAPDAPIAASSTNKMVLTYIHK